MMMLIAARQSRTRVVDNGMNPCWMERFHFTVEFPPLAFLKFTVYSGNKEMLGQAVV